jgi:cytochrome c-type biogenesis protein CcmH/NrfF
MRAPATRVGAPTTLVLLLLLSGWPLSAQQPSRPVDDRQVHEVAAELRCVVC